METNHDPEIEARLKMAIARAHRPLSSEELALVREQITRDVANRDELRSLPLANSDAPDSGFNPRVAPNGGFAW